MNRETASQVLLDFNKREGLLPVIVQDVSNLTVLMLAWSNQEAFEKTISSGNATFWSTSRKEIWEKGATSGDYLKIKEIRIDCDQDTLLYLVEKAGEGACHTKNSLGKTRVSCFYRKYDNGQLKFIDQ